MTSPILIPTLIPAHSSGFPPSHNPVTGNKTLGRALIAAAMVVVFSVGVLVGREVIPANGRDKTAPVVTANIPYSPDGASATSEDDRAAYDFQNVREANAPRASDTEEQGGVQGFGYQRLTYDTSASEPSACIQFSSALDDSGETNYGDYIRVTPETKPAFSVNGEILCLTGLGFHQTYQVTLRAGLPSAAGDKLAQSETLSISFGDKPAVVAFVGDGVILPRLEADGLGIRTVNVKQINVTVRRVNDRALFQRAVVKGEATGANQYPYFYGPRDGTEHGVVVYEGKLATEPDALTPTRNETVTTIFPLGATLKGLEPGAYFIQVEDASTKSQSTGRAAQAWRWVMYTDMALTSYQGADGLDVFVRSIDSARPLVGAEMSLVAQNNEVLGTNVSNADGRVHFDAALIRGEGPRAPKMIMAYGSQSDFAALDLTRAPLDLSERNIGGRDVPPLLDAYAYLDRGIYRPGETVHVSSLLRDNTGRAVDDRSQTVKVFRPNGVLAHEQRIEQTRLGGFSLAYALPQSAPRGVWRMEVLADGVGKVGGTSFSVEDFVPQRLEVILETDQETPLSLGQVREVSVESRFLYGAPAANLPVEATLRYLPDPNPFPDYQTYQFGPESPNFSQSFRELPKQKTDAQGKTSLTIKAADASNGNGVPLRADLVVGVIEPGGRVVSDKVRVPVRVDEAYAGVRLEGNASSASYREPTTFETVLVDRAGAPIKGELEWRLVRQDYEYDWYQTNSRWQYRRNKKEILISQGRLSTDEKGLASFDQKLTWGDYQLSVWQQGSTARSEKSFYAGWRSQAGSAQTPDEVVMTAVSDGTDEGNIAPGTRARLFIAPPYAGEATIVVATDRVHMVQRLRVEEEGREIIIDTDPDWGSGFYVMATLVTPRDAVDQPIPRRALGVHHVSFDMAERSLNVSMDVPKVLQPRQTLNLPVKIDGAGAGEEVMLTLAAVDQGILQLTKFPSPDPKNHFFGKKRLGLSVHDDYGRILNANLGAPTRFGGDQIGGAGLSVVPTKTVALFSGAVRVDANGAASVPIEVPDFNGELRLMAVAWSRENVGNSDARMTVRDRVPAEVSLSRFLAPGDTGLATISINNVDGARGEYQVELAGSGPIMLDESLTFTLDEGAREERTVNLRAGATGIGFVSMNVTGPENFSVTRAYPIEVRTPWYPVSETSTFAQSPGEKFALTDKMLDGFIPGTGAVTLSYSRLAGVEAGALLDGLRRYPYGCTEQLTSSSFPLLYVDTLGGEVGRGPEYEVRPRVQTAINKLMDRQSPDGAFGLWRVSDRYSNPWLGAYVTDFLFRAKDAGYTVPNHVLENSYTALAQVAEVTRWTSVSYAMRANFTNSDDTNRRYRLRASAYAHYVLARAGRGDLSDIRYFHDVLLEQVKTPLVAAHIGAALAGYGDRARAENAFRTALEGKGFSNSWDYYQTPLRDAAGIVTLIVEAGYSHLLDEASEVFTQAMKSPDRMHTQEKAFVLMAANAMLEGAGPLAIAIDGQEVNGLAPAPVFSPDTDDISAGRTYENRGEGPVFLSVTRTGSPERAPASINNGVKVNKRFLTFSGKPISVNEVKQNDRFVVLIDVDPVDRRRHPFIIADLLPSGFEIETILTPDDNSIDNVGTLARTQTAEARDDRFVAALTLDNGKSGRVAYVVRAITPGTFSMPGAVVEDMYRPEVVGRTAAGTLTVTPASGG